ncbi:MAG TPA: hypothetical protein VF773_04655 [Verrucomicrobiae bacterium]
MSTKVKTLAKIGFLALSLYAFWVSGGLNITPQELWRGRSAAITWLIVGWAVVWFIVLVQLLAASAKRRT